MAIIDDLVLLVKFRVNSTADILSKLKHWRFLGFYCSLTRLAIQFPIRLCSLAICGDLFLAANDHTYTNAILKKIKLFKFY